MPHDTNGVKDGNNVTVATEVLSPVASKNLPLGCIPHKESQAARPRRILLRGEPSKEKGKGAAAESAPIKKKIMSENDRILKKCNQSRGGNQGVIIS